jgi:hypothetical protein
MSTSHNFDRIVVLEVSADGKKLRTARDATDLISELYSQSAQWLAIPISRLDEDFFRLRTGVAGEVVSKLVQFRVRVAFIGDISQYVADSDSFRDFVREANRGSDFWFVADFEELRERLASRQSRGTNSRTDQKAQG